MVLGFLRVCKVVFCVGVSSPSETREGCEKCPELYDYCWWVLQSLGMEGGWILDLPRRYIYQIAALYDSMQ